MFVFLAPLGRQVTPYSFLAEQMVMAHADGVRLGRAGWRTDSGGPAIAKRQGAAKLRITGLRVPHRPSGIDVWRAHQTAKRRQSYELPHRPSGISIDSHRH